MPLILIIDDKEILRAELSEILEAEGYVVKSASDGTEGLAYFESYGADLIITDLLMPETDGMQVIKKVKSVNPNVKIIAASAGGRIGAEDYLKLAERMGADRVFKKPYAPKEIIEGVAQLLEGASEE